MAYLITNAANLPVLLSGGARIEPGQTRPITEIGTHEHVLIAAGILTVSRDNVPDAYKDDARYVEVINPLFTGGSGGTGGEVTNLPPATVQLLNVAMPVKNTWYLVSNKITKIAGWKMQLRRVSEPASFDYAYVPNPTNFMTCFPGEAITADADFPALYARCQDLDNQVAEFEFWVRT